MKPESQRSELTLDDYYTGVRSRDPAVLPRALTLMDSTNAEHALLAEKLLTRLLPHTGTSMRVGITGAPGVGKSTFIESLGLHLVGQGKTVAVLAVDPSSGVSGGSILGDKTRMTRLSAEPNALIRPMPSAGWLGGVSPSTRENIMVCEAAGFDVVLVETVGVGQSETMVADMTDCFVALMLPGAGDELQGIKRGILEYVDVIVVNKADGENRAAAELAAKQFTNALNSFAVPEAREKPDVLTCSALHHEGIDVVWQTIEARLNRQSESRAERRNQQNLCWMWSIIDERLHRALQRNTAVQDIQGEVEAQVLDGELSPAAAARHILEAFGIS